MAASCREFTGLARPATTRLQPRRSENELCFSSLEQKEQGRRRRPAGRGVTVVAAVSEELPKLASAAGKGGAVVGSMPAPPGKVAVRAALTVRRKHKEDLKEAVAGNLDALWDMVGRGVVLELISTKIHPSKQQTQHPFLPHPSKQQSQHPFAELTSPKSSRSIIAVRNILDLFGSLLQLIGATSRYAKLLPFLNVASSALDGPNW
jgi:hypothetical protein